MDKAILYIHGKGGNAQEAGRYKQLCPGFDVYGLDYHGTTPWETVPEIQGEYLRLKATHSEVTVIANSIGAYFAMNALQNAAAKPQQALFISPIVDMVRLITDMMAWAGVDEQELQARQQIETDFGETLQWQYLCYARQNPIDWHVPTHILYGEHDNLTARPTVEAFAQKAGAKLTVMPGGEHWFHTGEQMEFLGSWLKQAIAD